MSNISIMICLGYCIVRYDVTESCGKLNGGYVKNYTRLCLAIE